MVLQQGRRNINIYVVVCGICRTRTTLNLDGGLWILDAKRKLSGRRMLRCGPKIEYDLTRPTIPEA